MLDLTAFDALTFDCYGTLIDWETGILDGLRPVAAAHGSEAGDDELLEAFARHEAALEAGPYLTYRDVLAAALRGVGSDLGFEPGADEVAAFSASVASGRRSRTRPRRSRRYSGASGSALSRTATTTCSRSPTGASGSSSTGS